MIRISLAIFGVICLIAIFAMHLWHNATNLLLPTGQLKSWKWEQTGRASGGVVPDQEGLRIDVIQTDGVDWHLQLFQESVSLKEGHKYRLSFMGKSSVSHPITVTASKSYFLGQHGGQIGEETKVTLENKWTQHETAFSAGDVGNGYDRVPLIFFGEGPAATVWLKDIRLEQVD